MKLLVSARFNVVLLLVFGAVCALGTVAPSLDVYRSWWFIGLLGLLALDVALCKLRRPPPGGDPWEGLLSGDRASGDLASLGQAPFGRGERPPSGDLAPLRQAALERARSELAKRPLYAACDGPRGFDPAAGLFAAFASEGWRLRLLAEASGVRAWVGDRGFAQRWGSLLSHASLVVIFAAGLAGRLMGFSEQVRVIDGGTAPLRNRPWTLALDRFTVEHYEADARPKLFASELRVLEGSRELGRKRVVVNDPLDIGGVRFYQSSWGVADDFEGVVISARGKEFELRPGVAAGLPGTRLSVTAEKFLPDFTSGEGLGASASPYARQPALRVRVDGPGKSARVLWLRDDMPDTAFAEGSDGSLEPVPPPPFKVLAIHPRLFSGIEVGWDPGYPFLLAGSAAWCAGLVLLFGLHRRRVWVVLSDGPSVARLETAGWSLRGDHAFHGEFQRLAGRAKALLAVEGAAGAG